MQSTSLVNIIKSFEHLPLTDKKGRAQTIEIFPPCPKNVLAEIEYSIPCSLPPEFCNTLDYCHGFKINDIFVDLTGKTFLFGADNMFPNGVPIAKDACGNHWLADLNKKSHAFGPIYFVCHDPAIVLYQCATINDFVTDLFQSFRPDSDSRFFEIKNDQIYQIDSNNPGAINVDDCINSDDLDLKQFASNLDSTWMIVDLRNPEPGYGFSCARFGHNTEIQRCNTLPIFAYRQLPEKPRRGFLSHWFG